MSLRGVRYINTGGYAVTADYAKGPSCTEAIASKARAELAAHADCTESQMMAMLGWTDPKMLAHYIAQGSSA